MVLLKELALNPLIFLVHTIFNAALLISMGDLNDIKIYIIFNMLIYGIGLTAQRYTIDLAADTVMQALEALKEANKTMKQIKEHLK